MTIAIYLIGIAALITLALLTLADALDDHEE
jgi:hypothetical protein